MGLTEIHAKFYFGYAERLASSADAVVISMVALAFAIYLVLIQFPDSRRLVALYWKPFLAVSFLGNICVCILIWRLHYCEAMAVFGAGLTNSEIIHLVLDSARNIRCGIVIGSFSIFCFVIWFTGHQHKKMENEQ